MRFSAPTTQSDPSGFFGILGTAAAAVLTLLVAFGVDIDADQQAAILGVIAVVGPMVTAWRIRKHAYSPDSVEAARAEERARLSDTA